MPILMMSVALKKCPSVSNNRHNKNLAGLNGPAISKGTSLKGGDTDAGKDLG